ncbi:MAG: NAD(+) synthase [Solirubrobacterales bacterium]
MAHRSSAACRLRGLPVAAGRDEHEAAGPQAARVHPGPIASPTPVIGTPNLLEYDQGFFVKGGDGLADVKPIAGLYKGQVYAVARELGLPEAITSRSPTTETFSLPQTQEEFYFGHSYQRMDELMWGHEHGVEPADLVARVGMSVEEVEVAYAEIDRRRTATAYLHAAAVLFPPET